jgi:hypothetical protein
MLRLLGLVLVALVIWFVLERMLQVLRQLGGPAGGERRSVPRPPAAPESPVEALVRCSSCGVHVPLSRTLAGAPAEAGAEAGFLCERCRSGAAGAA